MATTGDRTRRPTALIRPWQPACRTAGQTFTEYSLILGFIALVAMGAFALFGPAITNAIDSARGVFP